MSLWSINAAKRKEEIPGTSKWIRNELLTVHNLMVNDLEQFAYSVASEFTWIDEQMDEVLNSTEANPRLLLESPKKLQSKNSPVKKLRQDALGVKSPLKEIDLNVSQLSPIKFQLDEGSQSPSPERTTKITATVPLTVTPKPEKMVISPIDEYNPFLDQAQDDQLTKTEPITTAPPEPSFHETSRVNQTMKDNELLSPIITQKTQSKEQIIAGSNTSQEDSSFQAIRTAIRKSIIRQAKTSESQSMELNDSSFKSAGEEKASQQTSLIAERNSMTDSVETLKVPLKDDGNTSGNKNSNTPPRSMGQRESQGFALLPHRGPLTVKSAKKKDPKPLQSLFSDPEQATKDDSTGDSATTLSNSIFQRPLYPSLDSTNLIDSLSLPSSSNSGLSKITRDQIFPKPGASPSKLKQFALSPLKKKLEINENLQLNNLENSSRSPEKKPSAHSPFNNLFSSVSSTLKKAKAKFVKETQFLHDDDDDDNNRVGDSPSKKAMTQLNSSLPDLTTSTRNSKAPTSLHGLETNEAISERQSSTEPENVDEVDDESQSLHFTPVKSIYSSIRREMNKTVHTSPMKPDTATAANFTRPKEINQSNIAKQPSNNPIEEPESFRKSFSRGGGLTSVSLDPSKAKSRPKSLASEPLHGVKRKTLVDDETRAITPSTLTNQPTRKIGTKILPSSSNQVKQTQDAKRRRTAEQLQNVLQKKATRVSNVNNEEPKTLKVIPQSQHQLLQHQTQQQPLPPSQLKYPTPTQSLMKTAVLQHARLNNDPKKGNIFNPKSSMVPSESTALPEIFSESDDDDEGSVLKDWANSPELRNILKIQQHIDPDKVFGPIAPLQMEEIFRNSTTRISKLKHRGSSAQWTGSDALTIQEVENYKKKYKK